MGPTALLPLRSNYQVRADRTIVNSKLDGIICDYEKETCVLIYVAISGGRNVF
jgi:hypothetical protein